MSQWLTIVKCLKLSDNCIGRDISASATTVTTKNNCNNYGITSMWKLVKLIHGMAIQRHNVYNEMAMKNSYFVLKKMTR